MNKDCESNETVPLLIGVLIKPGGNQGNKNLKETRISRKQEIQGNKNFKETRISRKQEFKGNNSFKETRISRKQEFQGNKNFKETRISRKFKYMHKITNRLKSQI